MSPLSEDPRIEAVARAICRAHGRNPDNAKPTGKLVTERTTNGFQQVPETTPEWMEYLSKAIEHVAAHDALR